MQVEADACRWIQSGDGCGSTGDRRAPCTGLPGQHDVCSTRSKHYLWLRLRSPKAGSRPCIHGHEKLFRRRYIRILPVPRSRTCQHSFMMGVGAQLSVRTQENLLPSDAVISRSSCRQRSLRSPTMCRITPRAHVLSQTSRAFTRISS